eukprot:12887562-Ditylum_brightwellii.AAC.1
MNSVFRLSNVSLFLLFFASKHVLASVANDHGNILAEWLKSENGELNPKTVVRRKDPNDNESTYGYFANDDLAEGEILFVLPRSIIMSNNKSPRGIPLECDTVRVLAKELKLGSSSKYSPYINYLAGTQPPGQLPSAWSDAGKDLFKDLLRYETDDALPPDYPTDWITHEWHRFCRGSNDLIEEHAAELVLQRGWDNLMIPIYDMLDHRNGHWFNSESTTVRGDESIQVYATRDIMAGEETYNSYNLCKDCGARLM